ncbi:hypothetical protein D3C76_1377260 [compost metagenome]
MNQDRHALGQDSAIGELQGWNLFERIEFLQRVGRLRGRLDINEAIRNITEFKGGLDGRGPGVLMAVELVHNRLLAHRDLCSASSSVPAEERASFPV